MELYRIVYIYWRKLPFDFYKIQIFRFHVMNFFSLKRGEFSSFRRLILKCFHQLNETLVNCLNLLTYALIFINFRFYVSVSWVFMLKKGGIFQFLDNNPKKLSAILMKIWWIVYIYWCKLPFKVYKFQISSFGFMGLYS